MKILNKLTYDYLKLNKKKCIATLVSIILITVLFTVIVNIFTYFTLKKINMIESLKSIE